MRFSRILPSAAAVLLGLALLIWPSPLPGQDESQEARPEQEDEAAENSPSKADGQLPANPPIPENASREQLRTAYYNDIARRFADLHEKVNDPLVDEDSIRRHQQALLDLREELSELVGQNVELREETDPVRKFVSLFDLTLREVRVRIPKDLQTKGFTRTGFPVPDYPENETLHLRATKLRSEQQSLARHFLGGTADDTKTPDLILRLCQALEDLAWEAGWPFTKIEADAYRKDGGLSEETYASRLKRGLDRIQQKVSFERSSVGRSAPPKNFILYRPADKVYKEKFVAYLKEKRGVTSIPEFIPPFDEESRKALLKLDGPRDGR